MAKSGGAGFSGKGGPAKGDSRRSMPQGTAVGSGSRPGRGRVPLESSAPADARNLGGRGTTPGEKL